MDHTFAGVIERYSEIFDLQPEGYGIDKKFPDIIYVPEDVHIDLHHQSVTWAAPTARRQSIRSNPASPTSCPPATRWRWCKPADGQRWRLIGTNAEGTFCHKPCTVSGGGKSEISKSLSDAMITASVCCRRSRRGT